MTTEPNADSPAPDKSAPAAGDTQLQSDGCCDPNQAKTNSTPVTSETCEQSDVDHAPTESAEAMGGRPDSPSPETAPPGSLPGSSTVVAEIQRMGNSISQIDQRLASIEQTVADRLRQDETKEQMFKALHKELKDHRDGALRHANKRLLMSLLVYHDHLRSALDKAEGQLAEELAFVLDELLGVLYSEDVEPLPANPGDEFNGREHKALQRVATSVEAEDKTINRVERVGFRWGDQILRPSEVSVRRFDKSEAAQSTCESPQQGEVGNQ
ncbi:MAG: nucleotide exchange factor GrpE [Planctomycetota bacterium]